MIILGYPGVGKSTLAKLRPEIVDLESSKFRKSSDSEPDWELYCKVADNLSSQGKIVFVSTHDTVQQYIGNCSDEPSCAILPVKELQEQWIDKLCVRWDRSIDNHEEAKNARAYNYVKEHFSESISNFLSHVIPVFWIKTMDYALTSIVDQIISEDANVVTYQKSVVFDFDGVIHSYTSGWQGYSEIPDPPIAGIATAISQIRNAGFLVKVVSTRCKCEEGKEAIGRYLDYNNIVVDAIMYEKPPAIAYIDDRAIHFDRFSDPSTLLPQIMKMI